MFLRLDKDNIEEYLMNDYLLSFVQSPQTGIDNQILQTREYWNMIKHPWKRMVFDCFYKDIFGKKILDVAGAYCGVKPLIESPNYTLLECKNLYSLLPTRVIVTDVREYESLEVFDYVVCSDLLITNFHNVKLILDKFLPICRELRISLTFRYLKTKEFNKWTLDDLNSLMHEYCITQERNMEFVPMEYHKDDCLPDNRNVYLISLKGDL